MPGCRTGALTMQGRLDGLFYLSYVGGTENRRPETVSKAVC